MGGRSGQASRRWSPSSGTDARAGLRTLTDAEADEVAGGRTGGARVTESEEQPQAGRRGPEIEADARAHARMCNGGPIARPRRTLSRMLSRETNAIAPRA